MTGENESEVGGGSDNEISEISWGAVAAWTILFVGFVLGTWDSFFRDREPGFLTRFAFGFAATAAVWLFAVSLTKKPDDDE